MGRDHGEVVAETPGTRALATASHGIAASRGYPDGEKIPRDEMIAEVALIVRVAGDLPVTADLEAGYGDPGGTVARAIDAGAAGCNLEDQMKPLADAVKAVEAAVAAAQNAGVDFVLNARTDAFVKAGDRDPDPDEVLADAIARGRAYLEAGASNFFVPGLLDEGQVARLVDAIGERKVNLIGVPGSIPPARAQELGVSRVSYGPWSQNVALTALAKLAEDVYAGGGLPSGTRKLNCSTSGPGRAKPAGTGPVHPPLRRSRLPAPPGAPSRLWPRQLAAASRKVSGQAPQALRQRAPALPRPPMRGPVRCPPQRGSGRGYPRRSPPV